MVRPNIFLFFFCFWLFLCFLYTTQCYCFLNITLSPSFYISFSWRTPLRGFFFNIGYLTLVFYKIWQFWKGFFFKYLFNGLIKPLYISGFKTRNLKKLLHHLLTSTGADEKFYVSLTFSPTLKAFIISLCSKTSEIPWVIQHADFFSHWFW